MKTRAYVLTCDICKKTEIIKEGGVDGGWREFYLGDMNEVTRQPKMNDICPSCANKLIHVIGDMTSRRSDNV